MACLFLDLFSLVSRFFPRYVGIDKGCYAIYIPSLFRFLARLDGDADNTQLDSPSSPFIATCAPGRVHASENENESKLTFSPSIELDLDLLIHVLAQI